MLDPAKASTPAEEASSGRAAWVVEQTLASTRLSAARPSVVTGTVYRPTVVLVMTL